MHKEMKGQVALVTGAGSGLGTAIATMLAHQGVKLALVDQREGSLAALRNAIDFDPYPVDVTREDAVRSTIETVIRKWDRIDIVVNSAGITGQTNIKTHQTDASDVRKVFDVNFMGAYFTSKHALPHMVTNGYGRILHIASIAGKDGNAGMLAYSASKAAVIGMTKVQGKEYAGTGITVNALAPAVIRTAMVEAMPPEQVKYMTDKIPMNRCGTLEEVASVAAYIVSPQNSFTTGFTFDLSGGRATY